MKFDSKSAFLITFSKRFHLKTALYRNIQRNALNSESNLIKDLFWAILQQQRSLCKLYYMKFGRKSAFFVTCQRILIENSTLLPFSQKSAVLLIYHRNLFKKRPLWNFWAKLVKKAPSKSNFNQIGLTERSYLTVQRNLNYRLLGELTGFWIFIQVLKKICLKRAPSLLLSMKRRFFANL